MVRLTDCTDNEAQSIILPVPRTEWKNTLRQQSHRKMRARCKDMPPHFRTVSSVEQLLPQIPLKSWQKQTQGSHVEHRELNYHLNKYKPHTISKSCPHCDMEDETINHFIGQCRMWFNKRGRYFNCFYASVSEVVDNFSLDKIVGFICSINHLNQL